MQCSELNPSMKLGMMATFYSLALLASGITGCSKSPYDTFQQSVLQYAQDQQIDQQEYQSLAKQVQASQENWAMGMKDSQGIIDDNKLRQALLNITRQKKLTLAEQSIWQSKPKNEIIKFNVDILLENSASMDGYVNGKTEFEATLLALLSKLSNASFVQSVNYGFVSDHVVKTQPLDEIDAIEQFTDSLEPAMLQSQVGNRGSSDIAKLISVAVKSPTINNKGMVVLVSDFIFSPPNGQNATSYMSSQGAYLEGVLSQKIKQDPNFAILVLKMISNFNGLYYDQNGGVHKLNTQRPYYIWFFGQKSALQAIEQNLDLSSLNQYQDRVFLTTQQEPKLAKYAVMTTTLLGTTPQAAFNVEQALQNNRITDAKVVNGQKPIFNVDLAVDLPLLEGVDVKQALDVKNYHIDKTDFVVSQVKTANEVTKLRLPEATNNLTLSFVGKPPLASTDLHITFEPNVPTWIADSSTRDDTMIDNENASSIGTFGIDILLNSAFRAFNPSKQPEAYFDVTIDTKKS